MSFFQQEGDDSNLQYDDAAFLYFIASALSIAAISLTLSVLNDLLALRFRQEWKFAKAPVFKQKIRKVKSEKRRMNLNGSFLLKLLSLALVCVLFMWVYE